MGGGWGGGGQRSMSQMEGGGGINTGVAQICVYFLGEGRGGGGGQYIHNTDGVGNPAHCIHRGGPFAGPGSRGRRLPRPWACKRPPEMDTGCEDFLARLYCIYFTSCSRIVHFVSVLCVFCACC